MLYDVKAGKVRNLDANRMFADVSLEDCRTDFWALGFTSKGEPILEGDVGFFYEPPEEKPRSLACPTRKQFWRFDMQGNPASEIPTNYRVSRYSKVKSNSGGEKLQ